MNRDVDDKIIEILNKLSKEDVEYIANSLNFNIVTSFFNSYIHKHEALDTHSYLASAMGAKTLQIYFNKYMERVESGLDHEMLKAFARVYFNSRNKARKLEKTFPKLREGNLRIISLNFDNVDKIYKAGQRGLDNRWHNKNKKKLP